MQPLRLAFRALVFAAVSFIVLPVSDASADSAPLSDGQLDALVAPVALYPDQMLAKVMIASTYPLEVVQAAQWQQQNSGLQATALQSALASQTWDDSVKEVAQVPSLLKMMSDNAAWTQKLGDAVLAQQDGVIAAVQRLRAKAMQQGTLKSTSQQTVQTVDGQIVIEPVQSEAVYVPYYNTRTVYGDWMYDDYPPYYWPPPYGYGWAGAGLGFLAGVIIGSGGGWWNNGINWGGRNVYVDHRSFNRNTWNNYRQRTAGGNQWSHSVDHRRGVNYSNGALRQQYGRGDLAGAGTRQNFRGFDNSNLGNRGSNLGNRSNLGNTSFGDRSSLGGNSSFDRGSFGSSGPRRRLRRHRQWIKHAQLLEPWLFVDGRRGFGGGGFGGGGNAGAVAGFAAVAADAGAEGEKTLKQRNTIRPCGVGVPCHT
jgi:hypothetical protein